MLSEDKILKFQHIIETDLRTVLYAHHEPYMVQYFNFKNKIGRKCLLCKQAAKTLYALEFKRKGQDFIQRFSSNNWIGYE